MLWAADGDTRAERLLRTIAETSPAAITIHRADTGEATFANSRWEEITGQPMDEAMGHGFLAMIHPDDTDPFVLAGAHARKTGQPYTIRYRLLRADGEQRWLDAQVGVTLGDEGDVVELVAITADVTQIVRDQAKLAHLATHDSLTGLPNRTHVSAHLDAAIARSAGRDGDLAVLFCDLDRFKPINDRLGHSAGDLALQEVAERLRSAIRASDLAGRLGGDEFVAVLEPVRDEAEALELARRIIAAIEEPMTLAGNFASVSASIGVAISDGGSDADDLLRAADAALYRAKADRGCVALADGGPTRRSPAHALGRP
ncbi:MAG: sensor domain-containing diguanylate cyclase [Actinomycetota bacterium]